MTTVAYRKGILAGDSKVTAEGSFMCSATKIRKVDGCLIGGCGNLDLVHWFLKNFKLDVLTGKIKLATTINEKDDFEGLIIDPKGKVFYYSEKCLVTPVKDFGYYAIGSGSTVALGAMYAGATAREAVMAAIKFDVHTGGPIKMVRLR